MVKIRTVCLTLCADGSVTGTDITFISTGRVAISTGGTSISTDHASISTDGVSISTGHASISTDGVSISTGGNSISNIFLNPLFCLISK